VSFRPHVGFDSEQLQMLMAPPRPISWLPAATGNRS
jgi:hypothetical protein